MNAPATASQPARRPAPARIALLAALAVLAVAALPRLLALGTLPAGFAPDELAFALAAREGPSLLPGAEQASPFAAWFAWLSGALLGWTVLAMRLPAALFSALAAAVITGLTARTAGVVAGLVAGVVGAASFAGMLLARRADPASAGLLLGCCALGCALHALRAEQNRWRWWLGCGVALGLGLFTHPAFIVLAAAGALAALALLLVGRRELAPGLVMLGLLALPLALTTARDPATLRDWLAHDLDGDGTPEQIGAAGDVGRGWLLSFAGVVSTPEQHTPLSGLAGHGMLHPLLAGWVVLGGGWWAWRRIVRAGDRWAFAAGTLCLGWFVLALLPAALVAPGHPALLLPALPALLVVAGLATDEALGWARERGARARQAAVALGALMLLASAGWSLDGYLRGWAGSDAVYHAYRGDLRDALDASRELAARESPVTLSLRPEDAALLDFLAAGDPPRTLDGRTTLPLPAEGGALVIYPASSAADPALDAWLATTGVPLQTGATPEGAQAWQAWRIDQRLRASLPLTVPTIRFGDGWELVGFAIAPDYGDVARTGVLPDPARIAVTLVWRAPVSSGPHTVQARLLPVDSELGPSATAATSAELRVTPWPVVLNGSPWELLVTRVSVLLPRATTSGDEQLELEVRAGLAAADGSPLPALAPAAAIVDGEAFLNRIAWQPDSR